ncbi:HugZ family protein [Oryzifoliimicrobium ureilyticus]|uniref:HugZ family pyridoxamine 5'-phosphate oxidase n=1 Tax=Oryzifoliimicrobium ureilyticus TaxID=3113724 RepID=UPI00307634CC
MKDQTSTLRQTDDDALELARKLQHTSPYAALAVIDPQTQFPFASRILLCTDMDGCPAVLVSALATHTAALREDGRASLLVGEPGKGDPLAYARMTIQCRAKAVDRDGIDHKRLRKRFLARHPKAALYIDFTDFCFFRLMPEWASLNGGFGRAYRIEGRDLLIHSPANALIADHADEIERYVYEKFPHIFDNIAAASGVSRKTANSAWRVAGVDCEGLDIAEGELFIRYNWEALVTSLDATYSNIAKIASVTTKT